MEIGALEMKGFSRASSALFSSAKCTEVLGRLGHHISKELEGDSARRPIVYGNVEENLWIGHFDREADEDGTEG